MTKARAVRVSPRLAAKIATVTGKSTPDFKLNRQAAAAKKKKVSFMLSKALSNHARVDSIHSTSKPLWDISKIESGQFVSQTAYLRVTSISARSVTVENSYGKTICVSRDILEHMHSADHYDREVPMNMTELNELLSSVGDHVFTVTFRKQPNLDHTLKLLSGFSTDFVTDKRAVSQLSKSIVKGQACSLVCHQVQLENNLGRSLVIDLNAKTANKFRQVDHRSIESVVFRNTKYVLSRSTAASDDATSAAEEALWDPSKLAEGNWFSGTNYYEAVEERGAYVLCKRADGVEVEISKDILANEMHSANAYDSEVLLWTTQLAEMLAQANNKCFTVCFAKMLDEGVISEKLASAGAKPDEAGLVSLAKDLLAGQESIITGRLARKQPRFGRSLVMDLTRNDFRQVDHRTIKWLIINNTKYIVKRMGLH